MNPIQKMSDDPRVLVRRAGPADANGSCVVYWMQRTQRAQDNPALDVAVSLGNELRKPVTVFFAPVPFYPGADERHLRFLASGIADIADGLRRRGVGLVFRPYPEHSLFKFCEQVCPAIVVGDENPLRETEAWRQRVASGLSVPFWTVDADVIVPSRLLGREHYGARTIRPRLLDLLPKFLKQADDPVAHVPCLAPPLLSSADGREDFTRGWTLDRSIPPANAWRGGNQEAVRRLDDFVKAKLAIYPEGRNQPESQSIALRVRQEDVPQTAKRAFLEQLIVRRELAVNFIRFNPVYDSMECLEPWADRSFAQHSSDHRPVVYSNEQLDTAETHDPLWNAAQKQMVLTGWMHNYLRMYWAKKILEWSPSIASAYQRAIWLNDRYELDGRDPNGYAGVAWAIVGKHDRPWVERPVFGRVRYMSLASTGRKFDSKRYIEQIGKLERAHV
jgi:deoxyribodipyrimidine photo-lyase